MTTQRELRKSLQAGVTAGLAARSFHRRGRTERYVSQEWVAPPLRAELVVAVESDRYGAVRISGVADIVVPEVDDFLSDSVPPKALSTVQEIYYGQLPFSVALEIFDKMDGVDRRAPLEWRAHSPEDAFSALEEFLEFVDGPVRRWFDAHSSVAAVRTAAVRDMADAHGSIIRTVSALDVVLGDLDAAVARLEAYRPHAVKADTPERVDAFLAWLKQAAAARSADPGWF